MYFINTWYLIHLSNVCKLGGGVRFLTKASSRFDSCPSWCATRFNLRSNPISCLHQRCCEGGAVVPSPNNIRWRWFQRAQKAAEIEEYLDWISLWAQRWQVSFSAYKTKSMVVSRKQDLYIYPHPQLYFMDAVLQESSQVVFLGVTFTSQLSWVPHITEKSNTISRLQGMLFRSRHVLSPACIARVYKACVRSIMESASLVWNGAPLYVLRSLDAQQRKCQRMLPDISLEPLQLRRDVAGLSIRHHAAHGKCPTPASNTILIPSL